MTSGNVSTQTEQQDTVLLANTIRQDHQGPLESNGTTTTTITTTTTTTATTTTTTTTTLTTTTKYDF